MFTPDFTESKLLAAARMMNGRAPEYFGLP